MNSSTPDLVDCRIVGADKLPADAGGSEVFCNAIRQAAAEQAPGSRFTVEVQVLGPSVVTATVTTADGTRMPQQKMAVSDRELNRDSLERFARVLAGEVARAEAR